MNDDLRVADRLNTVYWSQVEEIKNRMLHDGNPEPRIDVHKIIACTQLVIMQHLYIRRVLQNDDRWDENPWENASILETNADFAIHVAISILEAWFPDIEVSGVVDEHPDFLIAHRVWLMNWGASVDSAKPKEEGKTPEDGAENNFPIHLLAEVWYLAEEICRLTTP